MTFGLISAEIPLSIVPLDAIAGSTAHPASPAYPGDFLSPRFMSAVGQAAPRPLLFIEGEGCVLWLSCNTIFSSFKGSVHFRSLTEAS